VQHAERAVPAVAFITAEQAAAAAITGLDRGRRRVAPGVQGRIFDVGGRLAPRIVLLPLLHRLIRRYTA
jgi:short-subunit dehydrogenase